MKNGAIDGTGSYGQKLEIQHTVKNGVTDVPDRARRRPNKTKIEMRHTEGKASDKWQ